MVDEQTIERCKNGDVQAFHVVYQTYEKPLLGMSMRMLGQQADAEDAVQQCFLQLYRGIHKFRNDAKFSTYLYRIQMNVCLDLLRKKKHIQVVEIEETELLTQDPDVVLQLHLKRAIDQLPEQQKACFVLFAVKDMKQEDIAEILGISQGTVKANIHHAKNRLRKLLKE